METPHALTLEEIKKEYPDQYIQALEAALAAAQDRCRELEKLAAECPDCEGSGMVTFPAHAADCNGECRNCPVPEHDRCEKCHGAGYLTVGNITSLVAALREKVRELEEKTQVSIGIGDGTGQMFVHGSCESTKLLQDKLLEYDTLRSRLKVVEMWKESVQEIMKTLDLQGIAKALGIGLGESIPEKVLPAIQRLQREKEELSNKVRELESWKRSALSLKETE